jgi:hypothetical protein
LEGGVKIRGITVERMADIADHLTVTYEAARAAYAYRWPDGSTLVEVTIAAIEDAPDREQFMFDLLGRAIAQAFIREGTP